MVALASEPDIGRGNTNGSLSPQRVCRPVLSL